MQNEKENMKMKDVYTPPETEIIVFDSADVIRTSVNNESVLQDY